MTTFAAFSGFPFRGAEICRCGDVNGWYVQNEVLSIAQSPHVIESINGQRKRAMHLHSSDPFVDELVDHPLRKVGPRLELIDDDAADFELAVVAGLDLLHVFQQDVQPLPLRFDDEFGAVPGSHGE